MLNVPVVHAHDQEEYDLYCEAWQALRSLRNLLDLNRPLGIIPEDVEFSCQGTLRALERLFHKDHPEEPEDHDISF